MATVTCGVKGALEGEGEGKGRAGGGSAHPLTWIAHRAIFLSTHRIGALGRDRGEWGSRAEASREVPELPSRRQGCRF